jgi:peptide/nickel transport system permease protein
MLEVLRQDYVRTARAKGVRERAVITKHALRNALIPFVTLLAGVLPTLVCRRSHYRIGVSNWPGMGRFAGRCAWTQRLIRLLCRSCSSVPFLVLIGYLISDILYTVVDPRIRLT